MCEVVRLILVIEVSFVTFRISSFVFRCDFRFSWASSFWDIGLVLSKNFN
jgi:hypothetical protein